MYTMQRRDIIRVPKMEPWGMPLVPRGRVGSSILSKLSILMEKSDFCRLWKRLQQTTVIFQILCGLCDLGSMRCRFHCVDGRDVSRSVMLSVTRSDGCVGRCVVRCIVRYDSGCVPCAVVVMSLTALVVRPSVVASVVFWLFVVFSGLRFVVVRPASCFAGWKCRFGCCLRWVVLTFALRCHSQRRKRRWLNRECGSEVASQAFDWIQMTSWRHPCLACSNKPAPPPKVIDCDRKQEVGFFSPHFFVQNEVDPAWKRLPPIFFCSSCL